MKKIKLTESQKTYIVYEVTRGIPQKHMAYVFGVSPRTIYRILVERAVITPRQENKILQLLKKHNIGYESLKELLEGK